MLKNLQLFNFRSYASAEFKFSPEANLVLGPNGIGKTNLLEAVAVLSKTRSFRAVDKELLAHGQAWYKLAAATKNTTFEVRFDTTKAPPKKLLINQKPATPEHYIGRLPTVLFEPSGLEMITGSPDYRRRYLDMVIAGTDRRYLTTLLQYKRAIKQRNSLLKKPQNIKSQLFAWDFKISELAFYLVSKRLAFIEHLNRPAASLYSDISHERTPLGIEYKSNVALADYPSSLLEQLTKRYERDRLLGYTSAGPHRDDLIISFKQQPIASIASRGEVRTVMLVFKFLEVDYLEKILNTKPILLLDDVFSELDEARRGYLLDRLKGYQSIITSTDLHDIAKAQLPKHVIVKL